MRVGALMVKVDGLTARQVIACVRLAAGVPPSEVARELGVHPGTVSRWSKRPVFRARLERELEDYVRRLRPRDKVEALQ